MSPGVSVAPSEAAERCNAVRVSASEPTGRSGDRHRLRSIDPPLRRKPSPPARIVEHRRDRGGPTAAHVASWTSADSIICIANRFWDLMPLRRDQKLFPHFGEAGTAVFAVEELEYSGHDPTSLFELICTIRFKLSFFLGFKM
jgi:hypothetical protein